MKLHFLPITRSSIDDIDPFFFFFRVPIQFRIHENDVISKTVLKQKRRFKVFKILARYLRDENTRPR